MMITLGIDTGVSGAVAVLENGTFIDVFDIPTMRCPFSGSKTVDTLKLHNRIAKLQNVVTAKVEGVWQLPRQSSKSGFSFGRNFQAVVAVLDILEINTVYIKPKEWQKQFMVVGKTKTGIKSDTIVKALAPTAKIHGARGGVKDGRCDAILIGLAKVLV